MKIIKLIFINILILLTLLVFAEILFRSLKYAKSCYTKSKCEISRLFSTELIISTPVTIGLSKYDPELGYVPLPKFDKFIPIEKAPDWYGSKVSIDKYGFRKNDNNIRFKTEKKILVSGDSFTFGDQVNNNETWPACLENKIGKEVDNAGVFGYGTAQALRRIIKILEENNEIYDTIILSNLLYLNFNRDKYSFRSGFPIPAVIKDKKGHLLYADTPDYNVKGSRFNKDEKITFFENSIINIFRYSFLLKYLQDKTGVINNIILARDEIHPNAAPRDEVIEWVIQKFSKINKEKFILLQYPVNSMEVLDEIHKERKVILSNAKKYNIKVIDTYNQIINNKEFNSLYFPFGHHNQKGNNLVCQFLNTEMKLK